MWELWSSKLRNLSQNSPPILPWVGGDSFFVCIPELKAIFLDDIYINVRILDAETVKNLERVEELEQLYREAN
ncbi:hypothetical protein [Acaryochloris marina]|nr:hypothetical protein [Acaryochloris marina]